MSVEPVRDECLEFVRFCYRRRRVGWPELYDEMCAVAGRGLFRGYAADDLARIGIGLCLGDMPGLAAIAAQIVSQEQAARRPVAVRIVPDAASREATEPRRADEVREAGRPAMGQLRTAPAGA